MRWPDLTRRGSPAAEGLVVDGVGEGVDFEAVGGGVEDGGFFGLGAGFGVVVGVFHAGGEEGLPVAEGEEVLLIVVAGVAGGFDVDETELAGVGAFVEVGHGHGVGVVPAGAEGGGGELEAALAVGWNERSALFFDSVNVGGISMPCQWTSSGVSVSLKTSTEMGLPSFMRRMGPGDVPL